jgi:phosphoglycolate phosphatase
MLISQQFIFWDWNGTLLNDTATCLSTMNDMLLRRGMPTLSLDLYKEVFGFPVVDYYKKIGFNFDKESFEFLSVEFIDAYNAALGSAQLALGAKTVIKYFIRLGKRNVIISAMKQDMLLQSVREKGLESYFTDILGIDTIYASSKSSLAINFVKKHKILPEEVLFIGDTTHDYEVANEIGCQCILIADGHQTQERLKATGAVVIGKLTDLLADFRKTTDTHEKKLK